MVPEKSSGSCSYRFMECSASLMDDGTMEGDIEDGKVKLEVLVTVEVAVGSELTSEGRSRE